MSARENLRARWRSATPATLLYAPANDDRKAGKVDKFGAEAVILDLEDAVPIDQKVQARGQARARVAEIDDSILRFVRVNNMETDLAQEDIRQVACADLDGFVYPKVQTAEELWQVDSWIAEAEAEQGLDPGQISLIALVETARGVARVDDILERVPDRLLTIGFGLGDYSVDMGVQLMDFGTELDYPRGRLSVAARAAGLAYAIDGPWLRVPDIDGLRGDTKRSRSFGFAGRQVIHPTHVAPATQEYLGLTEERIDYYRRVVAGFEDAIAEGSAALQIDGQLVDYPIYYQAQRALAAIPSIQG
jgi:citrate lyase subunit beta/citryl-CoA lyase